MIKHKSGQVLLITVMVLATILTVVLSVSFQSVTETQTSKLEEESQKALAAAEAAIEASLKEGSNVVIGEGALSNFSDSGFTGGATVESLTSNTFTTPTMAKDTSYTLYMGAYDADTNTIGPSAAEPVTLCFDAGTVNPAIEVTLIKAASVKKYAIDPENPKRIANAYSVGGGVCPGDSAMDYYYNIPGADIGVDSKLMIVRVMYASTKIFATRSSDFPIQGKTVSSTVSTQTGVSKKVVLFQSNPQIPAEYFATTF